MAMSAMSGVLAPGDVYVPRAAASAGESENPAKTVHQIEDSAAGGLNERRQPSAQQDEASETKREKRYELQDRVFVYSVSDAKTGFKVAQFPSEEAMRLRAYLAQQEAAQDQRKQDAQKQHLDIVA